MTNPEDIFSHLPPEDRPAEVSPAMSQQTDRERTLSAIATGALMGMPVHTGPRDEPTHYSDFDRGVYIREKAAEIGLEVDHMEAMRALEDADEILAARRQDERDLQGRSKNWREHGADREGLSGQDQRDLIRLTHDDTLTPQDILPEQAEGENS